MSRLKYAALIALLFPALLSYSQPDEVEKAFRNPAASAKPWVFWYWMNAAVSKQGITADLQAMKSVGIGGAYLMPIKDTSSAIPFKQTARQLSPEWWALVKFAMQEAKRLDLKLTMHVSDGFALAGGPWITPALSMQKLVWTKTYVKGEQLINRYLEEPENPTHYYKDIAVFAYPSGSRNAFSDQVLVPSVTTSNGTRVNFLSFRGDDKESFKSDTACWIQYKYPEPFTCRSICIHTGSNNYQAQRMILQASDDGINFRTITRLHPPRHGWQDTDEDVTHAIPATTASYFRFVYDKDGSEPGAEDLDAAKWKPSLKLLGIYLSDEPVINQYETKNGSIWRVSEYTTTEQAPDSLAVPLKSIIDISDKLDSTGKLKWTAPPGNWVIVRIGHTSTGHTNATGGGGKGLECDKFNPVAIKLQFDNWFAKAFEKTDKTLAGEVLKLFHVDSWECGSQNWSDNFKKEFLQRRGYDLTPYLVAMTGTPVENAGITEKVLHDTRQTIAELINDIFYASLKDLAHKKGCAFSAESVAPTMVSDGMLHYKNVDIPMGEFWLNSPTHDKPNDMLDAISGGHIYGKNIIQAEAFTSVRMNWGEYPGNLKAIGDRNFALGINKMVLHVFTHNPWVDKKPGMTLDGVGLYFQRDQTWFKQSKAWIDYLTRCQSLLQLGKPVVDIAVFTGEEIPRRSILPDRFVSVLPGIFGNQKVEQERIRLENKGQPLRTKPDGVTHSANMADPEYWIDPLNGYTYDSFNPDALLMASVQNGRIVLPGGAGYKLLVIPGIHPMQPHIWMSLPVAKKLLQLVKDGAVIIIDKDMLQSKGDAEFDAIVKDLLEPNNKKGKLIFSPYIKDSFAGLGLQKDLQIYDNNHTVAWTHRQTASADIYFISNQQNREQAVNMSFPITDRKPEVWDPVEGTVYKASLSDTKDGRAYMSLYFVANQSTFVVFKKKSSGTDPVYPSEQTERLIGIDVSKNWKLQFDKNFGGPAEPVMMNELQSWTASSDSSIRFYSGTVVYNNVFNCENKFRQARLTIDSVYNIATVFINGINCGTIWTTPYQLDITKAVRQGSNTIRIEVSNTWGNRLIGDQSKPIGKRTSWTTAPFRLANKPLLPAGLTGNILILTISNKQTRQ
jgi:hypothetical protein